MKRIIALLLCLTFFLVIMTACSGTSTDTGSGSNDTVSQNSSNNNQPKEYKVGEVWTVDGQWELTVTGFEETSDRNEFSDKNPGAVYIVSYTYKNIGYTDDSGIMDGLYITLEDSIVDSKGIMGYSYPLSVIDYPQEAPVGASCKAQVCIGVDNAGTPIKINVTEYDSGSNKQTATFVLE